MFWLSNGWQNSINSTNVRQDDYKMMHILGYWYFTTLESWFLKSTINNVTRSYSYETGNKYYFLFFFLVLSESTDFQLSFDTKILTLWRYDLIWFKPFKSFCRSSNVSTKHPQISTKYFCCKYSSQVLTKPSNMTFRPISQNSPMRHIRLLYRSGSSHAVFLAVNVFPLYSSWHPTC